MSNPKSEFPRLQLEKYIFAHQANEWKYYVAKNKSKVYFIGIDRRGEYESFKKEIFEL